MQGKLVKADFLGAHFRGAWCLQPTPNFLFDAVAAVAKAKNQSLVDLHGIVIEETEGTFRVITPLSAVKGQAGCQHGGCMLIVSLSPTEEAQHLLIRFAARAIPG